MSAPRIHLHIDRLVLRGVPESQRDEFVIALQAQLQAQLVGPGSVNDLGGSRSLARLGSRQVIRAENGESPSLARAFASGLAAELKR